MWHWISNRINNATKLFSKLHLKSTGFHKKSDSIHIPNTSSYSVKAFEFEWAIRTEYWFAVDNKRGKLPVITKGRYFSLTGLINNVSTSLSTSLCLSILCGAPWQVRPTLLHTFNTFTQRYRHNLHPIFDRQLVVNASCDCHYVFNRENGHNWPCLEYYGTLVRKYENFR